MHRAAIAGAVLLLASRAVTTRLTVAPAVTLPDGAHSKMRGREQAQDVNGAPGAGDGAGDRVGAVIVWLPAVLSVTVKVPVPLVNVLLAGSTAWVSLLVKDTVPV